MKSKMTNRNKTFWIIAILVIALFFTFNTLPDDRRCDLQFHQL